MLVFTTWFSPLCPLGLFFVFFHFAFNDDKLVYSPRKRMRILTRTGKLSACSGDCEYSASSCNAVPSGWPLCTQADSVECCSHGNGAAISCCAMVRWKGRATGVEGQTCIAFEHLDSDFVFVYSPPNPPPTVPFTGFAIKL